MRLASGTGSPKKVIFTLQAEGLGGPGVLTGLKESLNVLKLM